jgi:hypothetical protein
LRVGKKLLRLSGDTRVVVSAGLRITEISEALLFWEFVWVGEW